MHCEQSNNLPDVALSKSESSNRMFAFVFLFIAYKEIRVTMLDKVRT